MLMSRSKYDISNFDLSAPSAGEQLLAMVYNELRELAAAKLASERPGITLQATALVHEAYLRMVGNGASLPVNDRHYFFAAAGEAMRRILIERARQKGTVKHGGNFQRVDLDQSLIIDDGPSVDFLGLDEALTELESHDAAAAQLVKLRYFAGLSHQDAAEAMQISRRAADRLWALARVWLYRRLTGE